MFSGECITGPGAEPKWVVKDAEEDAVSDIKCRDGTKCYDPPFPSTKLINDVDNLHIDVGRTFRYFCNSTVKGLVSSGPHPIFH